MKIFVRIIALCLVFCLCFAAAVSAFATDGANGDSNSSNGGNGENGGDPDRELQARLDAMERRIRELERAENDAAATPRRPLINVTDPLWIDMDAGSQRTVEFTIRNLGADGASGVITTADLSEALGITGIFMDGNHSIPSIGTRSQRTFSFQISVNETVKEGFHNLTFKHEYLNALNERISSESHITIRVANRGGGVSVRNIASSLSSVAPGQDFDLTAAIHNEGSTAIRDVSMTIADGMAPNGIFLRASTNVVMISDMRAGQRENISIAFTAAQRAARGAYPLKLELSFTDGSGERRTQEYTYFVSVGGTAAQANAADVIISGITQPGGRMGVGQEFEMAVTLRNTGQQAVDNIRVEAVTDSERAIVPRSTSIMRVARLEPGGEQRLSFRFAPTALAKSQNYVVGFTVSYASDLVDADGNIENISFTQYQGVNVSNPDSDNGNGNDLISTPRIIVSDYRSDPLIVQAGQEFDLELTFLNTSSNRLVRNIRVTLSVEEEVTTGTERRGSVFTPVGRSSTFFIDSIAPRGEVMEHIRFFTLPDAPPRNYIINVDFEYEDADNNPFKASESIGINVKQVTNLDTSEIFIPDFVNTFEPIFINFELYNTGRVKLSNLMIRVEGNFDVNQSSVFYGSLSPGSMDFYDNVITPFEAGMQELAIIISYEDDTGELIEERKEFVLEVFDMDMGDMNGRPPMWDEDMIWDDELQMFVPAPQGLGTWAIIGIAAGVLAVAGAVVFEVLRRKKKKKESIEDEEFE